MILRISRKGFLVFPLDQYCMLSLGGLLLNLLVGLLMVSPLLLPLVLMPVAGVDGDGGKWYEEKGRGGWLVLSAEGEGCGGGRWS